MCIKSIILAGGSGTRLWPLSRELYPKQFLKIRNRSLFQDTVSRCLQVSDISEIYVITNESHKYFVIGQVEELGHEIPEENLLLEPEGKNTLPAICYGIKEIEKAHGNSVVGVFSSDHVLDSDAMETIADAQKLTSDYLVTFGIVPAYPHTGYGYIKPGEELEVGKKVLEFREKPCLEDAEKYISEGCLWNSGMFLFDTSIFLNEVKDLAPEVWDAFDSSDSIQDIFAKMPNTSIDYGIMEKSSRVSVVELGYKWSDMGNFNALYTESEKDDTNSCTLSCENVCVDSNSNFVYSKHKKLVSLIDINDMIVVDTTDALLVCPRKSSEKVKSVVNILKERNDDRINIHETVYRPWGSYTLLENSAGHKIKNISVLPKKKLSLQLHHHRSEHWVVVKGMACVENGCQQFFLRQGESTFIRAGVKHRLSNPGKFPLEIIEVQLGEYVEEDDIVRFDDEYGRS
ncbi:mannose-1-phosphate guanylyltransferase/mannose-6-phosphate isomerase [Methanolobus halotolerans]|uniref:mannose-1-phosphate guanylyltransferase n=1 Tax=Methanolobus halotolerans TaxID=2052935 RepID=A0A4E0Q8C1_9EURY|nr:mannose-1-phosphate guanylyltransferase/mannose-6-phosphate isomerase [Methanolobus halotolerans]TGC08032.1 mannose-1-phosphate guanylyltransferase/mannose-6-phosphate isomerase [Methanolobus halotolerans]